jgi:hypothetical protein
MSERFMNHWMHRIRPGNLRGYTEDELLSIDSCRTMAQRRKQELQIIRQRIVDENTRDFSMNDSFGLDALKMMEEDVKAIYRGHE